MATSSGHLAMMGMSLLAVCLPIQVLHAAEPDRLLSLQLAARRGDSGARRTNNAASRSTEGSPAASVSTEWIPVSANACEAVSEISELVTRRRTDGTLEMLLVRSPDDITDRDVGSVFMCPGPDGGPAFECVMTNDGWARYDAFVMANIGRHLTMVAFGKVRVVGEIRVSHGNVFFVYQLSESENTVLRHHLQERITVRTGEQSADTAASASEVWRPVLLVTAAVIVVILVVMAAFPARGLRPVFPRKACLVGALACGCLGLAIGAYAFGFSGLFPPITVDQGGQLVREHVIHLPRLLLGGLGGAAVGAVGGILLTFIVRRAVFNLGRLLRRLKKTGE